MVDDPLPLPDGEILGRYIVMSVSLNVWVRLSKTSRPPGCLGGRLFLYLNSALISDRLEHDTYIGTGFTPTDLSLKITIVKLRLYVDERKHTVHFNTMLQFYE